MWDLVAEASERWQEDVGSEKQRRRVKHTGTTDKGVVLSFPLSRGLVLHGNLLVGFDGHYAPCGAVASAMG